MKSLFEIVSESSFLELLWVISLFYLFYFLFSLIYRRKIKAEYWYNQLEIDIFFSLKNYFLWLWFMHNYNELGHEYMRKFRNALKHDFAEYKNFTDEEMKELWELKYNLDYFLKK